MSRQLTVITICASLSFSCGASQKTNPVGVAPDPEAVYGALEVGVDYKSYKKINTTSFLSKTHGGRFVDVYVNDIGADAYMKDQPIPVGTVVVKTSWEVDGGKATEEAGPIFVMRKESPGYDPDFDDWYYAIHWGKVPARWQDKVAGPFYWRGKSKKVDYCRDCHDNHDRELGGIPKDHRSWQDVAPAE